MKAQNITFEIITASKLKKINIHYGFHDSLFGLYLLCVTDCGICHLSFLEQSERNSRLAKVQCQWHSARFIEDQSLTASPAEAIFTPSASKRRPLHLLLKGTDFQINVWKALMTIPSGTLVSYEMVAKSINNPLAIRAAANAVANNSIAYLIPCHRVIYKTGEIGKFRWGSDKKKAMIEWELKMASTRP